MAASATLIDVALKVPALIIDLYNSLIKYGINVDVFDPVACPKEIYEEYGLTVNSELEPEKKYEVIALMVPHDIFVNNGVIYDYLQSDGFVYDLKSKLKGLDPIDRLVL